MSSVSYLRVSFCKRQNTEALISLHCKKIKGQGRGLLTLSLDLNLPSANSKGNLLNLELFEIFL